MTYVVAYDVSSDRIASTLWLALLLGLLAAAALGVMNRKERKYSWVVPPILGLAWAFLLGCLIYMQHMELSSCQTLLRTGAGIVLEGPVEHFVPMPADGHALESFTVSGVHFSYSDFDLSQCGFRKTASHGGPIRSGLHVRITYFGKSILRLEVAASQPQPKGGA